MERRIEEVLINTKLVKTLPQSLWELWPSIVHTSNALTSITSAESSSQRYHKRGTRYDNFKVSGLSDS